MMIYRGCFGSFRFIMQDKNPLSCYALCSIRFPYLALSKQRGCYCGLQVGEDERPRSRCNQKCGLTNLECGGIGAYSIFLVHLQLPYYYGCFDIVSYRRAITLHSAMTVAKCLKHCEDDYFAFLTSGVTCSCQDEDFLIGFAQSTHFCQHLCADGEHYCGGEHYTSVYKTCTPACSPLLQCSEWDEFGICRVSCLNNHVGPHCVRKVDRSNFTFEEETTTASMSYMPCDKDGLCPDDTNTVCSLNKLGERICVCLPGFETVTLRYCSDINECHSHPCDNVSNCINTFGSYDCRCKPGATRIKGICEYVDKCNNMVLCDKLTTVCVNEGASYKCLCKHGFKEVDRFNCQDIDECERDESICGGIAKCLNIAGNYRCYCGAGLSMIKAHTVDCEDIDECNVPNEFPCNESNEVCINTFASYACECSAGFTKIGKRCEVVVETSTHEDFYVLPVKTIGDAESEPQPSDSAMYSVVGSLLFFCFVFLAFVAFRLRKFAEKPLPEFDENDIDLIRTHLPELLEIYRDERRSSRNRNPI